MVRLLLYPFFKFYIFIFKGRFFNWIIEYLPFFAPIKETRNNQTPIPFKQWIKFKVLGGRAGGAYFPIHPTCVVNGDWRNILVGVDSSPAASPGCYVQSVGKIKIGDYTQIAPHVGLISSNHFLLDITKHVEGSIVIGDHCRIGMASIIHPNVVLGDFVTVAAGSVVKDSFPNGFCVISGNPAVVIQDFSNNESIKLKFRQHAYSVTSRYNGFIPNEEFEEYRKKNLNF
jgi:acetyltransferase-like isoleucine patch superfamily enzyme